MMNFKIPSNFKKVKEVSQKILQCLEEKQVDQSFLFDVKLACEEAMVNAIKYGNKSQNNKVVSVTCDIKKDAVVISVEDQGEGFNYKDLSDPTQDGDLLKARGRGLFLIHNIMDKVEFNVQGNKVTMTKFFPKKAKGGARCR